MNLSQTCPKPGFMWLPFLTNGLLTSISVLVGLGGTALTFRATLHHSRRTRLGKYLVAMCMWDTGLLFTALGYYGLAVLIAGRKLWTGPYVYLYITFNPLSQFTLVGTIWTVVSISVERYLALSNPLRHRARGTRGVTWICMSIVIFSLLISFPTIFELTTVNCLAHANGTDTLVMLAPTEMRESFHYKMVYRLGCFAVFISPLPFLLVLILNIKTLCIPHDHSLQLGRRSVPGSHRARQAQLGWRERKIAFILSGMMFKFLLCYILPTVINATELLGSEAVRRSDRFADLVDISNLLVVVQSATNWVWFFRSPKSRESRTRDKNDSYEKSSTLIRSALTPRTQSRSVSVADKPLSSVLARRRASDIRCDRMERLEVVDEHTRFLSQEQLVCDTESGTILRTRAQSMRNLPSPTTDPIPQFV